MWGKPSLEAWGFGGGCLMGERSQASRLPHPPPPSALSSGAIVNALPLRTAPPPEKKGKKRPESCSWNLTGWRKFTIHGPTPFAFPYSVSTQAFPYDFFRKKRNSRIGKNVE